MTGWQPKNSWSGSAALGAPTWTMSAAYSSSTKPPIHKLKGVADATESASTDIVYLPGRWCAGILQPADVYWNKSFNNSLRMSWAEFTRKREKTPKGNLRKPWRQDVFKSTSWAAVPEEVVARSFKGHGINAALDGSEDVHLHK